MRLLKPIYYHFLLGGLLLFLFIPLTQNLFHLKKTIKPLDGAYNQASDTTLTLQSWFSGRYQEKLAEMYNEYFGFHNYYVRFNNQIDYSLFQKSNTDRILVGKGGFLYETTYIDAYFGRNFVGKEKLEEKFKKLKNLQDLLLTQGIFLDVIFAPGKASFYPEFIPDDWRSEKKLNNYEFSRDLCKNLDITFIDFNAWFMHQKDFSPYDLYPKTGIHWSNYGALLATDSIRKHIEKNTDLNLRDIIINNVSFSDVLNDPDEDIGDAMNLLFKIPPLPMPYAAYVWGDDNNPVKPNALFVGDSYFWNIYYEGLTNNLFTDCKFWYYNHSVFPETEKEREVKNLNLLDEIKKQKVIVLMATENNIHDIGWGFIEQASDAIEQASDAFKSEMFEIFRKNVYVQNIIEEIRNTPKWLADIQKKAKANRLTVDEQIKMDALYVYKTDYGRPEVIALTEDVKARIKNTPAWIKQIKKKAEEKNISVEEMAELDAKYIYVTEHQNKMN